MDPLMHVVLPVLFLLAIRLEPKAVVMFSPLAILPDFDAVFHLHRAVFHSFIPVLVIPLALIAYSRLRMPEWMLSALLVQFYMASHVVLDIGGVAFLWPFTTDMFFLDARITFNLQGGINFGADFDWGTRPYEKMGETSFISDVGFATVFLAVLVLVVFRKEAFVALMSLKDAVKAALAKLRR